MSVDQALASASVDRSRAPQEALSKLFVRFLKFGAMAWGGPVAQIAMLRKALVDEERWITSDHFNRVLALYQVLPGPEAHEMCVHFGTLARGRIGGLLAGLGFMLPGFVLMFLLSWFYFHFGLDLHGSLSLLFSAVQAAVIALIVRAVHRIGSHVLLDRWLWAIALGGLAGQLLGVHFVLLLAGGGLVYYLKRASAGLAVMVAVIFIASVFCWSLTHDLLGSSPFVEATRPVAADDNSIKSVSLAALFLSGLKAGMLTFGGAYTVIPFLQRDAVSQAAWMSNAQFMDGIALSGLLPAPLIIFATFVGYAGGGALGAVLLTAGIFLPAFAFPLLAHGPLDRLLHDPRIRDFLDGLMAAVVGLIAGTALVLLVAAVRDAYSAVVFAVALALLFYSKHRLIVPLVIAGALAVGVAAVALVASSGSAQTNAGTGEILFVCQHGNVKSLMAASYFNRLAAERGLPYRASARGSEVDTPKVPAAIATQLQEEGFDVRTFSAQPATAADVQAAKHIVLIETSLPGDADADAAAKVERWDDVPPASVHYPAASAALKAHVEKLLDQLDSR